MNAELCGLEDLSVWFPGMAEDEAQTLADGLANVRSEPCQTGKTVVMTLTEEGELTLSCLGDMVDADPDGNAAVTFSEDMERAFLHLKDGTCRVLTIEPSALITPSEVEARLRSISEEGRIVVLCQAPTGAVVAVDSWELAQRPSAERIDLSDPFVEQVRHDLGYRGGMEVPRGELERALAYRQRLTIGAHNTAG